MSPIREPTTSRWKSATDAPPGWSDAGRLRAVLLGLVVLGSIGLVAELLLLEHTESLWQRAPLLVLGAAAVSGAGVALRPSRAAVVLFRALMALCVGLGVLGLYLHYRGNIEFELEMSPGAGGPELFWLAMSGATPALAPGAMVQLGLLGLVAAQAYRVPGRRSRR